MVRAIADKLREARALDERGWTQGAYARDANGDRIFTFSDDATCFCLSGALNRVFGNYPIRWQDMAPALSALGAATGHGDIETWNDAPERTQADVLAAFDKAIELAEDAHE